MQNGRMFSGLGIAVSLLASALAIAISPLFMPEGYSWVTHTTSESAAQGVTAAWISRLGFLLFGLAVIWLAAERRSVWRRWATAFHTGFGVFMVATAVFSTRSWDVTVPYNPIEDVFHSASARLLGFCFAFGVLVVLLRRRNARLGIRWLDLIAVSASIVIPVSMIVLAEFAGVFQRIMFLVAYAWYLREDYLFSTSTGTAPQVRDR